VSEKTLSIYILRVFISLTCILLIKSCYNGYYSWVQGDYHIMSKVFEFIYFMRDVARSQTMIRTMSINDFKSRYAGSFFGVIWAFIQPIVTMLVLFYVFQFGFKSQPIHNVPFFFWLVCGFVPWTFFADSFSSSAQSLMEYNYLVKKVVFRTSILPIVKILSSLFVHFFFILFLFVVMFMYAFHFSVYNIQIFYYLFGLFVLLLGLGWVFSSIGVFFKDMLQFLNLIIQIGFWATPIFWSPEYLPEPYSFLVKLNPMNYIVQGYRDTFIYHNWFWERPLYTVYFWLFTGLIFVIGALIFRRLRPHFADVL
jgi:ABC-type polysaccharide/polyol phosphate export permease